MQLPQGVVHGSHLPQQTSITEKEESQQKTEQFAFQSSKRCVYIERCIGVYSLLGAIKGTSAEEEDTQDSQYFDE